ncbi:MAG: hypothetical protein RLZ56_986 [Bacteroidota bacterium]|jgi:hypothetical protein
MKKIISLLSFLYFTINVNAQDKLNIGIKLGQNFSNINSVAVDHNTASYHVGATLHFGITEKWGLAPEVILSQTKLETNINIIDVLSNRSLQPETYHLNYLSIPLLVSYKPFGALALHAGPQYSIMIDQKKDGVGNAAMAFKSGEFAFVGGAQFNFGGFFAYGRYVVGLQNINELQDQTKWKTTQWQLGVGMSLLKF